MKKYLMVIAVVSFLSACDRTQTNDGSREVATLSYLDMNGKMMAQHALMIENENKTNSAAATAASANTTSSSNTRAAKSSTRSSRNSGSTAYNSSAASERSDAGIIQPPAQKKGWSKAAKGAVIGGVAGAATGAIISKKKGKGAVIGGLIGAGGGYILGRSGDKKDGRY